MCSYLTLAPCSTAAGSVPSRCLLMCATCIDPMYAARPTPRPKLSLHEPRLNRVQTAWFQIVGTFLDSQLLVASTAQSFANMVRIRAHHPLVVFRPPYPQLVVLYPLIPHTTAATVESVIFLSETTSSFQLTHPSGRGALAQAQESSDTRLQILL
jgi:hypothetical protein